MQKLTHRLLEVLENNIIPLTKKTVAKGNKIFGAAILKKTDYSLVVAGSNEETKNPLWHGEITCLNNYWQLAKQTPPKECIFLSTHEPCSMCLSAITWSGFDNFYYFFSYENSKNDFFIPHDLKILNEVFNCKAGNYRKKNSYWQSHSIIAMLAQLPKKEQINCWQKVKQIKQSYQTLSQIYQKQKTTNNIPLN